MIITFLFQYHVNTFQHYENYSVGLKFAGQYQFDISMLTQVYNVFRNRGLP